MKINNENFLRISRLISTIGFTHPGGHSEGDNFKLDKPLTKPMLASYCLAFLFLCLVVKQDMMFKNGFEEQV